MVPLAVLNGLIIPAIFGMTISIIPSTSVAPNAAAAGGFVVVSFLLSFAMIYFIMWMVSALTFSSASIIQTGKPLQWREAYAKARPFVGRLFAISFLTGIITSIGVLLLIVPGVIFATWFALAGCTGLLENEPVTQALGRSRDLVRRNFWLVLGFFFLTGLVGFLFSLAMGGVLTVLGLAGVITEVPWLIRIPMLAGELVTRGIVYAFSSLSTTLLYFQLRARNEGVDLLHEAERVMGPPGTSL